MAVVQVYLDGSDECYPGQTISGRIECRFSEAKSIRAVRVKFKGKANTSWTESETYYDDFYKEERTRDVTYSSEEVYFTQEYNLVGGDGEFTLHAGSHTFPFSYILPQQLPSSFESNYGSVRYTIKAILDCPWWFDSDAKVTVRLHSPLDLNHLPRLRVNEPVQISVDKTMCSCWCNDGGALTFTISLPVTGYVPGQEVRIGAYVENMSNVSAEKVKFRILQITEHIAEYPSTRSQHNETTIASCVDGGIGAHAEKSWTSVLMIPTEMSFPNMLPCSIINIWYRLEAEITVPCPHTNLSAHLPLVIGDVPLIEADFGAPLGPPQQTNGYSPYPNATAPPSDSPPTAPCPTEGPSAPYPPTSAGDAPYMPAAAPYLQPTAGWSLGEPSKAEGSNSALPSYEEAQRQLLNKTGDPTKEKYIL